MFSANTEDDIAEAKLYIIKKLTERLRKSSLQLRGADASAEQLAQDEREDREAAKMIAEERGAQLMFMYQISKLLKKEGYRDLHALLWRIEAQTVTRDEMETLFNNILALVKQSKSKAEINSEIKTALQPYIERNSKHMKQAFLEMRQARLIAQQEADAAEQRAAAERQARLIAQQEADAAEQQADAAEQKAQVMQKKIEAIATLILVTETQYNQMQLKPFAAFSEFESWRLATMANIQNDVVVSENTQKWIDYYMNAYKSKLASGKKAQSSSNDAQDLDANLPFLPSSPINSRKRKTSTDSEAEPDKKSPKLGSSISTTAPSTPLSPK